MDAREEKALQDQLDELIKKMELVDPEYNVVDYVVIVEGMRYDPDKDRNWPAYGMAFQGGETRQTTAVGLMRMGQRILESGIMDSEEDDA